MSKIENTEYSDIRKKTFLGHLKKTSYDIMSKMHKKTSCLY